MNKEKKLPMLIVVIPVATIILFATLIISFFVNSQYSYFEEESVALEKELIAQSKRLLQEENEAVHEYIAYHRKAGFDTMRKVLQNKVHEAVNIAEDIYEYEYPKETPTINTAQLVVTLASMSGKEDAYFFLLDLSKEKIIYLPENVLLTQEMQQNLLRQSKEILEQKTEGLASLSLSKPNLLGAYDAEVFIRRLESLPIAIGTVGYVDEVTASIKQSVIRWLSHRTQKEDIALWVHDTSSRLIADQSRPQSVGTYDTKIKDKNGMSLAQMFIETAQKMREGNFIDYQWSTPEGMKHKIGFVKLDVPWQWVIGTAQNMDVILESIAKNKYLLQVKVDKHVQFVMVTAIVLMIVISLITLFVARSLYDLFEEHQENVKRKEWKLEELNRSLEARVQEAVNEAKEKDKAMLSQSRLAQMGEMISMIAHQWRQPLSEVSGIFMELEAASRFNKLDRALMAQSSTHATKLLDYMSKTIDDFRYFFKPSKDKVFFSVARACEEALTLAEASLKNSQIKYVLDVSEDKEIEGYPSEYAQVVLNLLMNAKDALREREVKEPRIFLHVSVEEGHSLVTVKDNGGGIQEDIKDHVFDPYVSTKTSSSGTGLGLYMSKMIIEENMHGKLWVQSDNEGATFFIKV